MRKITLMPVTYRMVLMFLLASLVDVAGGQVPVSAEASLPFPVAGEVVVITLSAGEETDFYSASAEISFDPSLLEFVSVGGGLLSEDGLSFAGELEEGMAGASVSRTEPLPGKASGSFMNLSFMVKTRAVAGTTLLTFPGIEIYDSEGEQVECGPVPDVTLEIAESIADIRLLIPAMNEIEEGELFNVEAMIFASGKSGDNGILCQVGVNDADTDPSLWDEGVWNEMIYEGVDENDDLIFSSEIAFMRPAGEWYVAVRGSLDDEGPVYGGVDGIWDGDGSLSASLNILPRPSYRYALAKWDFDNESLLPSVAVAGNRDSDLRLTGAEMSGFAGGDEGLAVNSRGWDGNGDDPGYWMVEISTAGFVDIELSSKQSGSNTGPRDFILEYSTDGTGWQMIEGGEITVAGNWTVGVVENLPLPAVLEDREVIFLRWLMNSNISVADGIVGSSGTNRIDGILVTGINPDPQYVSVYPGDSNNDGTVNADDVLPLGTWWLSAGPPAVWDSTGFIPRNIEQWIPSAATFADTNGDGVVDHRDLIMVGLHFGKSAGHENKDNKRPLFELLIDPGEGGSIREIMVTGQEETTLRGVAFNIEITGIPPDMWEIRNVFPAFAGEVPEERLLSFMVRDGRYFESAFALKGPGDIITGSKLAGLELVVDDSWNDAFTLKLNRLTVSTGNSSVFMTEGGKLVCSETLSSLTDAHTDGGGNVLMQNFPNPFTLSTAITFGLDTASTVRLEIISVQGKVVAVPLNEKKSEGLYQVLFDGSFLPPGVYFCRMVTAEGYTGVVRMVKVPASGTR